MTWTGSQLWVAGEFTTVNGAPQQGLTRFGMLPTATSAAPLRPNAPTLSSARPGEVRVSFPAVEDIDDPILTYTILRGPNTGSMAPIGTVDAASKPVAPTDRPLQGHGGRRWPDLRLPDPGRRSDRTHESTRVPRRP